MDLIFLVASVVLAIFCPLALFIFAHGFKPKSAADLLLPLPPGTFGLPIIGESVQFILAMRKGSAAEFIKARTLKYSSPVFKTSLFGESIVVLSGQAGNKFIFTNEGKLFAPYLASSTRKLFPSMDFAHLGARKNINLLFKSDAVHRLIASVDSGARQHLERWWMGRDEVRVHGLVKLFTISAACSSFMGVKNMDRVSEFFLNRFDVVNKGLFSLPFYFPGTPFWLAARAADTIREEVCLIIKKKKLAMSSSLSRSDDDDDDNSILSQMLMLEEGGREAEMEIADKILFFIVSGNVTTTAVITSTIKFLADNPSSYNLVLKEQMEIRRSIKAGGVLSWDDIQKMRYTWNYVSEVMRVLPTVQGALREAKTDVAYEGFLVPKGWKVFWSPGVTHKDPDHFPKPETFDPSRFEESSNAWPAAPPYTYIPFGAGPHMCPGREYARVTILVFLHYLITMFKWETLIPREKIVFDSVPIPAKGLPVRLFPL